MFLTGQSDIVGVCKRLEAKFGRNAMMKRRGKDRDVADSFDDKVSSLRSVAVSQGGSLHFFPILSDPCHSSNGIGGL